MTLDELQKPASQQEMAELIALLANSSYQAIARRMAFEIDAARNRPNDAVVKYCDQPMRVTCDRKCNKAWGINTRQRIRLSEDESDWAYVADHELGNAPADPGTYEGGVAKPSSPDEFPQKWCVRACERCNHSQPDQWMHPLPVISFDNRVRNVESPA